MSVKQPSIEEGYQLLEHALLPHIQCGTYLGCRVMM
jgi:hypothetical protein